MHGVNDLARVMAPLRGVLVHQRELRRANRPLLVTPIGRIRLTGGTLLFPAASLPSSYQILVQDAGSVTASDSTDTIPAVAPLAPEIAGKPMLHPVYGQTATSAKPPIQAALAGLVNEKRR